MIYRDGTSVRPERFLAVARVRVVRAGERVPLQRVRQGLGWLLEWKTDLRLVCPASESSCGLYEHGTGGVWSLPKRPRHGDRAAVHRATVAFAFLLSLSLASAVVFVHGQL